MALGRCRRCRKIASTAAKNCPHCGVKKPIRKAVSPVIKLVAAFAFTGTAALLPVIAPSSLRIQFDQIKTAFAFAPIAANVAESQEKSNEKHRFATAAAITGTLKQSMANPGSLEWETILANDAASVVCLEYRVKNGLGEYNREYMSYADGTASQTPEHWNKHCAGKKLNDLIHVKDAS